jgi:transposase-like protein
MSAAGTRGGVPVGSQPHRGDPIAESASLLGLRAVTCRSRSASSGAVIRKSKFSETQIVAMLKDAESGVSVADLTRKHGVSKATFFKWRSKYASLRRSRQGNHPRATDGRRLGRQEYVATVLNYHDGASNRR